MGTHSWDGDHEAPLMAPPTWSYAPPTWTEDAGRERVPLPPNAEPIALTAQDGVRLAGAHHRGPDRDTALVLVHGFGGAHDQARVDRIAQRWSARHGVVSLTMRGHGASQGRTTLAHREPMDVEAATAWARAAGYSRVVTVGFSMGAAVVLRHAALRLASDGYSGTDAVAAVSGPAFWFYRGTPPMRWLHRGVESPLGRLYLRAALGVTVDAQRWPDPPPMPPTAAAARIREHDIPLLIVHGDADGFFPLEHPRALHAAAPGSAYWQVPGFGHAEGAIDVDLVDRLAGWAAGSE